MRQQQDEPGAVFNLQPSGCRGSCYRANETRLFARMLGLER
ncbi:hypothetical protein ECMP0215528_3076 [Escherichia coli MP021552.8]|nr:hypothetical protein ECMP0215528_3076 [Escherichia coli MP021552.8]